MQMERTYFLDDNTKANKPTKVLESYISQCHGRCNVATDDLSGKKTRLEVYHDFKMQVTSHCFGEKF